MYFVGAVIITIKCNDEFTGLFHNIDFGQKKIVLIKRNVLLIKVDRKLVKAPQ